MNFEQKTVKCKSHKTEMAGGETQYANYYGCPDDGGIIYAEVKEFVMRNL